jgi:tRNA (guanine37-N1)-methyltransferase
MVMKVEPTVRCVESLQGENSRVIMMSPQGQPLTQSILRRFSLLPHLIIICGHYEGIDERVRELVVHEEISIGDYILTNGALAAMVLVDGVVRLIPGVLGHEESAHEESFSEGYLEYPHYTRPAEFRGLQVPEILLSGNHREIARWRQEMRRSRTKERRADLIQPIEEKKSA